jgi:drug/metabolite transporter (DMT)-like permease
MITKNTTGLSRATYLSGAAWGIGAISIWVGWILLTRFGVTTNLNAYDITALRFGCAGLILLPLAFKYGFPIAKIGWLKFLIICAGAGVPYVLIASSGLGFAPARHGGALIPGTMPLWAAIISMLFLGEKISNARRFGLCLIPVGIAFLLGVGLADFSNMLEQGYWRGHLLFLCAAICWASYTNALRASGLSALHATAIVAVVSAVFYLPIYALFLPHNLAAAPWSTLVIQTIFQGVFVSIVSMIAYARAVEILGASLGASFASLVPVAAMLAAIPLLGEVPTFIDCVGIIIITIGVFFASGASAIFKK